MQDTTGGRDVVSELAARHLGVVRAQADSGCKRSVTEFGAAHGIDVEVVSKDPGQKGFAPLPNRWAVERTFGGGGGCCIGGWPEITRHSRNVPAP